MVLPEIKHITETNEVIDLSTITYIVTTKKP